MRARSPLQTGRILRLLESFLISAQAKIVRHYRMCGWRARRHRNGEGRIAEPIIRIDGTIELAVSIQCSGQQAQTDGRDLKLTELSTTTDNRC